MSPITCQIALALLYYGAAGQTLTNIAKTLQLNTLSDNELSNDFFSFLAPFQFSNSSLTFANAMYVNDKYSVQTSYETFANNFFYATVNTMDFVDNVGAATQLNNWVENKTHNQVKNMFTPQDINSLTNMILVNAIYFKGTWVTKFNAQKTASESFYNDGYCGDADDSTNSTVQMMNLKVNCVDYSSVEFEYIFFL